MTKLIWTGALTATQTIDNGHDNWVLAKGASIIPEAGVAIDAPSSTHDLRLTLAGSVSSTMNAVTIAGTGHTIVVTATGSVNGGDGFFLQCTNSTLTNNNSITGTYYGIVSQGSGSIINNGTISGDDAGVSLSESTDLAISNNAGATISGDDYGLTMGLRGTLLNVGTIQGDEALRMFYGDVTVTLEADSKVQGGSTGIYSIGEGNRISNSGEVIGNNAILAWGAGSSITNEIGGTITGAKWGVWLGNMTGITTLTNSGTIGGDGASVGGGDGRNRVTNFGTINHDINLGAGNDTFTNKGGKVLGTVDLAGGSDTYSLDTRSISVFEAEIGNEGDVDKVQASVSYKLGLNLEQLTLTGTRNINATGNELNNRIAGNSGSNVLTGGDGDDTFAFSALSGTDKISDFVDKHDHIDLSAYKGIDAFADISITKSGSDSVIHLDGDDTITLIGIKPRNIDVDDFLF